MNILALSGFTGNLSKAGLAEGTNANTIKIVAPNGAGVDYGINGVAYHKADTDNISVTAHAQQAALTTCLYLVQLNTSGTLSTKKGKEVLTADLPHNDTLQWPLPDADCCPIGGYKVKTANSATFTNGSTDFSATDVTVNYVDFIGGMPEAPQTSTSS